jgi:cobalt-zinc-cadmium efflux system protein
MAHSHYHNHNHHSPEDSDFSLMVAISINALLTIFQIVGGVISGSLSLIADALHNLSDAASLCIAIFARKVSRIPPNEFKTFGYKRAEVIAALINVTILIVISLYLIFEAILRYFNPSEISGWIIVYVAGIALVVDLITASITYRLSSNNMNMKAAFLHNLADALTSLTVIVAGILIILFNWYWVDSVLTAFLGIFIAYQAFQMLPKSIHLLMEGVPESLNILDIKKSIMSIDLVDDMHHIHIWSIDENKNALEAHIATSLKNFEEVEILKFKIKKVLLKDFKISHSTLEFEQDCSDIK